MNYSGLKVSPATALAFLPLAWLILKRGLISAAQPETVTSVLLIAMWLSANVV